MDNLIYLYLDTWEQDCEPCIKKMRKYLRMLKPHGDFHKPEDYYKVQPDAYKEKICWNIDAIEMFVRFYIVCPRDFIVKNIPEMLKYEDTTDHLDPRYSDFWPEWKESNFGRCGEVN